MTIKSELLAIQSANEDGKLRCEEAVEWARANKRSALHKAIEWDNKKAADAHRLWQVRQLIELYIIRVESGPTLVSLSIDRKAGGGYRAISDVVARPDLREIMLQDALDELERVQARYQRVEALASVWQEAEAIRQRTGVKRRRAMPQEQAAA